MLKVAFDFIKELNPWDWPLAASNVEYSETLLYLAEFVADGGL